MEDIVCSLHSFWILAQTRMGETYKKHMMPHFRICHLSIKALLHTKMPGNKFTRNSCFPKMLRAPVERAHTTRFRSLLVGVYISALFWLSPQPIQMHAFLIQLILLPTALPKVITTTTKMVGPERVIF